MPDKIIEIYVAKDNIEAQFVRSLIEDAGFEVQVVGENLQSVAGEVPVGYATAPGLLVRREDAEKVRKIIVQYEASKNDT